MATSVSSSTSTTSPLSAKTGMAGLVSGLDTDSLVESLTTSSRSKIAKNEQKVQTWQWKQTAYRNVSKSLKEFQSKYLDVLSKTNFRSTSMFNTVNASTASTKIAVTSTSAASAGSIKINKITQLATSETLTSGTVSNPMTGTMDSVTPGPMDGADITNLLSKIQGNSVLLNLDGKVKRITFDTEPGGFVADVQANLTTEGLRAAFQQKIDDAFGMKAPGVHMINAAITNDQLSFTASGSQLTISALSSDTTTLGVLGFSNGQTDKMTTTSAINSLPFKTPLDSNDTFKFKINSVDFTFNKTDSISTVMSRVNSSNAGVTLGYSSISDQFTMTAKETGVGDNIDITDTTGNLLSAMGLTTGTVKDGQNAILTVNDIEITRASNKVDINGVNVDLLDATAVGEEISIIMKEDATSLKETITNFVTDYNNMIEMMNKLVKENADSDYSPLTEEQKADMSEKEIEAWETKAKVGLLQGDNILKGITSKMQTMIYGSAVSGGISLRDLGISSAGYGENGKLKIDDAKLTTALVTKGSSIKELFTTEKTGLAQQLNDIITGAVKTTGPKGTRGSLIEMAGYESTLSDTENSITDNISKTNKSITNLKTKLKTEETYYWSKFSALETALQQLNSQSSMLSQFSTGA